MDFSRRNIDKTNRNNSTNNRNIGKSGGVTIIKNPGSSSLSEARKEFLSKKGDDNAEGIINFRKGLKVLGNLINNILKESSDGAITDEAIMTALRSKKEFLSKKVDDSSEGIIGFKKGLKILDKLVNNLLTTVSDKTEELSDEAIMSAKRIKKEIDNLNLQLENKFLRKDIPDSTNHLLSLLGGAVFGKNGFASGITGFGAKIDDNGDGEMNSLILRRFLEVPELHFNRTEIIVGDKWRAAGGIFEDVIPDKDNPITGSGILKLEDGEYGQIAVGDICMGIFHSEKANIPNSAEDSDDGRGNFQFAGFYTCYFTITEITGKNNKQFRYQLRPTSERWKLTYHPSAAMRFVCYGSFDENKPERQCTVYETRTYTRMLWHQNTWEIERRNIAMQTGDMKNLNIFGIQAEGYSSFQRNMYFMGEIKQVKDDGTPILTANDRGAWVELDADGNRVKYEFYDRVSHNGGLWLCIAENGTTTEPKEGDPAWLCQVRPGDSLQSFSRWHSSKTPYPANAMLNFGSRVVISKEKTSEPPYPLMTDKDGNYIVQSDGSYLIASYDINPQWTLIIDQSTLKDGADGDSVELRYSSDKVNWHNDYKDGDKFMQMRTGDNPWSDPMPFIGEDGLAGKDAPYATFEFAVNDSLTDAPTSGWQDAPPAVGNGQYLWMRTGVVVPPATVPEQWNVARIKGDTGDKGEGFTQEGHWTTGKLVPKMGVVEMGGNSFVAKVATRNPPMWTLTDKEGNRIINKDGGYILTGELNTEEYDIFAQKGENGVNGLDGIPGADGVDGKTYYTWLRYADDEHGNGISNSPDGKKFLGLAYNKSTPVESNNPSDYMWSEIKGEQGVKGENGYTWIKYSDYATGYDETGTPAMYQQPNDDTKYIGIAPNKQTIEELDNNDPTVYTWSKFRGEDGEGFTKEGAWYTGKLVPINGIVTMGGGSYVAKVATRNPPLWTLTDKNGNRLKDKYGGYILTGGVNTAEYEVWAEKGEPGKDGVDGQDGHDGQNGHDGKPGQDGKPGGRGPQGIPGVNGCNMRVSEWRAGVDYVNETELLKDIKYIDIAFVRNTTNATGWDAYVCLISHTSSPSITYTNTTYWEKTSQNVTGIFASFILAKNAMIDLLQGNSILIQMDNGTVTAGATGSDAAGGIRFWAGSTFENRGAAPFWVNKLGHLHATDASITGEINATSGTFNNVHINGSLASAWVRLNYERIYSTSTSDVWGYNGSAVWLDNILIGGTPGFFYPELVFAWGSKANGRIVHINTINGGCTIHIPSGYCIYLPGGKKTDQLRLEEGRIYRFIGTSDYWIADSVFEFRENVI